MFHSMLISIVKLEFFNCIFSQYKTFFFLASNILPSPGSEFSEDNFVVKVKMEIVVSKDQV